MKENKKSEVKSETKKETMSLLSVLLFIPGCFLIGLAIGFLFDKILIAALFGLGLGFVLAAIFKSLKK